MLIESFDFRPSRILILILIVVHSGTLIVVFLFPGKILKVAGILLCITSVIWSMRLQFNLEKILWNEKQGWALQYKNKQAYSVTVSGRNLCLSWVVGLNFGRNSVMIFYDSMSEEAFRRLRVLLINK